VIVVVILPFNFYGSLACSSTDNLQVVGLPLPLLGLSQIEMYSTSVVFPIVCVGEVITLP
jgi:hypothetical protein